MSLLPPLANFSSPGQLKLPSSEDLLDKKDPLNKKTHSFNPAKEVSALIIEYARTLVQHIDKLISSEHCNFNDDRNGRTKWQKFQLANHNSQWHHSYIPDPKETKYGIRVKDPKGSFEKLMVKRTGEKLLIQWYINGFMPGIIEVETQVAQENTSVPKIRFLKFPLKPFSEITNMLCGYEGAFVRPEEWQQRAFHILVSEAHWLRKLADGGIWAQGEKKIIGDYRINKSVSGKDTTYEIQKIKGESDTLQATFREGILVELIRDSAHTGNKYKIELRADLEAKSLKLEDQADLLLIDKALAQSTHEKERIELERDIALLKLLQNGQEPSKTTTIQNKLKLLQAQLEELSKELISAESVRTFKLGYAVNKEDIQKQQHREALLSKINLPLLMQHLGMIYCDPNPDLRLSFSPDNERSSIQDFLTYTKMQAASVSLVNTATLRDCLIANLDGSSIDVTRFGDYRLRRKCKRKPDTINIDIHNVKELIRYFKVLGITVEDSDTFKKAAYRWGIRATKDELAKKGIFYVEGTNNEKDTVYVIDPGTKTNWQALDIKRVAGNKLDRIKLQSYPNQEFIGAALGLNESANNCCEDDLIKVFSSMGFNVPGITATEQFIRSKLHEKNNPITMFLDQRIDEASKNPISKGKYRTALAQRVATRLLSEHGCSEITAIHPEGDNVRSTPHYQFKYKNKTYLGCINFIDNLTEAKRSKLTQHAQSLNCESVILNLQYFDTKTRNATLAVDPNIFTWAC